MKRINAMGNKMSMADSECAFADKRLNGKSSYHWEASRKEQEEEEEREGKEELGGGERDGKEEKEEEEEGEENSSSWAVEKEQCP